MKNNNKGFTLVELIISFAILSIISVMVVGFMTSGSNTFRSVSSETNLQNEAQIALAQLQEYLIDCNYGVDFDDSSDTLYVVNTGSSGYTLYTFQLDGTESLINFAEQALTINSGIPSYTADKPYLMTSHVNSFNVAFDTNFTKATVTITLSNGGKSYTGSQTIFFRNQVVEITF